ncbi:MAG: hypothetical protein B7Z51_05095 [Methyloversatilis sp. 12-65-5]|nr:MAG: hypothetical protein B7Z51_05095 [Methyloversatilis sp. 12-65-5]
MMNAPAQQEPGTREEMAIRADIEDLRVASAWLGKTGEEHGLPAEQIMRLDQCLDEALANVIAHAGPSAHNDPVNLVLATRRRGRQGEAALTVIDSGIPFDPLSVQPKPRPASLLDAEPGGLGLMMMQTFADVLEYRHHAGRNHLTVRVRWDESVRGTPE